MGLFGEKGCVPEETLYMYSITKITLRCVTYFLNKEYLKLKERFVCRQRVTSLDKIRHWCVFSSRSCWCWGRIIDIAEVLME